MKNLRIDLRPRLSLIEDIKDAIESERLFQRELEKIPKPLRPIVDVGIVLSALYYENIDDMYEELTKFLFEFSCDSVFDVLDVIDEAVEYDGYIDKKYVDTDQEEDIWVGDEIIKSVREDIFFTGTSMFSFYFGSDDREEIEDAIWSTVTAFVNVLDEVDLLSIDEFIELAEFIERVLGRLAITPPAISKITTVTYNVASYTLHVPVVERRLKSKSLQGRFKRWKNEIERINNGSRRSKRTLDDLLSIA